MRRRLFGITLFVAVFFVFFLPTNSFGSDNQTPLNALTFDTQSVTKENLVNNKNTGIVLLDRNEHPFFTFYQGKYQTYTPLNQVPSYLQKALIASEDKDFYSHSGFSIKAIIRSFDNNIRQRKLVSGGSTITQQLVKNTLLSPERNILRKIDEIILAYKLEKKFSKNDILEMYLNSTYFGEGSIGIAEAAKTYFNKNVSDLSLAEASTLIGLLPSPSRFSPLSGDINLTKQRQKYVLQKMLEQKYISQGEEQAAENEQLSLSKDQEIVNNQAQHFAFLARDELIKKYGEEAIVRSGFTVKTTIDLDWQKFTENAVINQVKKLQPNNVSNGAAVIIDPPTGEIKALVGSIDWYNKNFGQVDVALEPRQPGSSFKPIYYSAALERRIITPATILKDQPITYNNKETGFIPYQPQNYDRRFRGQVLVRRALSNSLNVPSVEVLSKLGIPAALEMAERLGITTLGNPDQYGLSLALGAGEVRLLDLTGAYATFANYGVKIDPTSILEIRDRKNQVIYQYQPEGKQVLDPEYAFLISSILSDQKTRAESFGNLLDISKPAAVKTGTSENYRDSWTLGYTKNLAIGVWVGNNDGRAMDNVAGSLGAAPIWKELMEKYSESSASAEFKPPEELKKTYVCRYNGLLLKEATSAGYLEYFVPGTEPTKLCVLPTPTPSTSSSTASPSTPTPSTTSSP